MVPIGPMLLLVLIGSSLVLVHVFYGSYRFLLVLVRYFTFWFLLFVMVPIGPMLLLVLIGSSLVLVHVFCDSYLYLSVLAALSQT